MNFFTNKLSRKLLFITFVFVMLAEALIFIPSAAMYRQTWLEERAQAAGLLTLAIEGVPNFEGGEMLTKRFMQDTSVTMVRQKRMGRNQLVLGHTPANAKILVTDLRYKRLFPSFGETFRDFFSKDMNYIRILANPTVKDAELLEIIVPQNALKASLLDYSRRVLLWSLVISFLTGLFIYITLSRIIVKPLKNLADGLKSFHEDPKKQQEPAYLPARTDEIGQLEREFIEMKSGIRHALKQQERLATLGMAMTKINHDLRGVLGSALLIADRLVLEKNERIKHIGEKLIRIIERGVKLCEATLSFAQSVEEKPEPRNVYLSSIVGEVAGDVMASQGMVVFKNKVSRNLEVYCDPDHTYRILYNLFRNALQAMQGQKEAKLVVDANIKHDKAFIHIRDNGKGLAKSAQKNLFKAFTSATKKGGTGLGLTISRELARAQGGNLTLEYTGISGTSFILTLPLAKKD